jgi:undecaprenyl phosphate-alpha-L-ara4FN deformylase
MKLALKIDVDTLRGTLEGVPRLVEFLQRRGAGATFLFSLGPDHTGRAIRRVFRRGFVGKVARTSVLEHYGLRTLLYGTLLPGPDIGRRGAEVMRSVRAAGFEVGIHCWDHVRWQDFVAEKDAAWTEHEMRLAFDRFREVFGEPSRTHGAAGWQVNEHVLRYEARAGLAYCSDTRGGHPFLPVAGGEIIACPQLPTTLPTFDELIGLDGVGAESVAGRMLKLTERMPRAGHVFTLHAELEGMKLAPAFDELLGGWLNQGYELVSLAGLFAGLDVGRLPRHQVVMGGVPGRSGTLALQGPVA